MNITNTIETGNTRYYFALKQDIEPPIEEVFAQKLGGIYEDLEAIEHSQREIAARVYSYSAPQTSVFETHKRWDQELQDTAISLNKCALDIINLHEALPFFPLPIVSSCMRRVYKIELKIETMQEKMNRLRLILKSESYAKAVVLYKITAIKCEEICKKYKSREQINENLNNKYKKILEKVNEEKKILGNLSSLLSSQIKIVHDEIQQFYDHSLQPQLQIQNQIIEEKTLTEDQILEDIMDEKFAKLNISQEPEDEDEDEDEDDLILNARADIKKTINLRKEESIFLTIRDDLTLCTGTFRDAETFFTKIGNPKITHLIEQLETLAKELQDLQNHIQCLLQQHYRGNWEMFLVTEELEQFAKTIFEVTLERNVRLINRIRKELYSLLSTGQIRIGLNYAARLFAINEETRFTINHYLTNINKENKKIIIAVNNTFRLIYKMNLRKIENAEKIRALFFAARSTSKVLRQCRQNEQSVSKFTHRIATCLEILIARIGAQIIKKNENDDTWFNIINEKYKPDDVCITNYIEHEITKWLYFSQEAPSIALDTALYVINKKLPYKNSIKNKSEVDNLFLKLYNSYSPTHNEKTIQQYISSKKTTQQLTDDKFNEEQYSIIGQ